MIFGGLMARTSHDKIYQEIATKGGTREQGTIKIRNLKAINKKKKKGVKPIWLHVGTTATGDLRR